MTRVIAVFVFVAAQWVAWSVAAADRVLEGIDVAVKDGRQEIRIRFARPVRFVAGSPAKAGATLQIQLRPVLVAGAAESDYDTKETLAWRPSPDVPLLRVTYDMPVPGRPELTLYFERRVQFQAAQGESLQTLLVVLPARKGGDEGRPIAPRPQPPAAKEAVSVLPPGTSGEGTLGKVLAEARSAMTKGEYRRAIRLLNKVLRAPDSDYHRDAKELLGLARERNGQLAHAKGEYEEYLKIYPEGEASERVRQRLAGLLTAAAQPKKKLRKARKGREGAGWEREIYGSVSQFYARDESFTDAEENTVNQSAVLSDLDFNIRFRRDDQEIKSQFVGGHVIDFAGDDVENDTRVNSLFIDGSDRSRGLSARLGRQSRSTGGVLGRFDGGLVSYQVTPIVKITGVAGFPVESSTSVGVNTTRHFAGVSLDLGTFADRWDFNVFAINQMVDDLTDRRAVGGEVRYLDATRSFFSLVDYDVFYNSLNTLLFVGNWTFPDQTRVNLSLDYRNSPILTTTNALQGQGVEEVADLTASFSDDEIFDLASDRTARSRSATVGASRPINEMLQVSADVTVSNLSGTDASGGVVATESTGNEFFYSAQLIGNGLIKEGDIAILGLRYSDTSTSDTVSVDLNSRYPITDKWRFNPRFRVSQRWNKDDDGSQFTVRPSARLEYRRTRRLRFELEGGGEWSTDRLTDQTDERKSYFVTIGYRYDF